MKAKENKDSGASFVTPSPAPSVKWSKEREADAAFTKENEWAKQCTESIQNAKSSKAIGEIVSDCEDRRPPLSNHPVSVSPGREPITFAEATAWWIHRPFWRGTVRETSKIQETWFASGTRERPGRASNPSQLSSTGEPVAIQGFYSRPPRNPYTDGARQIRDSGGFDLFGVLRPENFTLTSGREVNISGRKSTLFYFDEGPAFNVAPGNPAYRQPAGRGIFWVEDIDGDLKVEWILRTSTSAMTDDQAIDLAEHLVAQR